MLRLKLKMTMWRHTFHWALLWMLEMTLLVTTPPVIIFVLGERLQIPLYTCLAFCFPSVLLPCTIAGFLGHHVL